MALFLENYLFRLGFKVSLHTILQWDLKNFFSFNSDFFGIITLFYLFFLPISHGLVVYLLTCVLLFFMELTKDSVVTLCNVHFCECFMWTWEEGIFLIINQGIHFDGYTSDLLYWLTLLRSSIHLYLLSTSSFLEWEWCA